MRRSVLQYRLARDPQTRVDPARFPEDRFPICCLSCDYPLRGLPDGACPECGQAFARGRLLIDEYVLQARRRRGLAFRMAVWVQRSSFWLMLVAAAAVCCWPPPWPVDSSGIGFLIGLAIVSFSLSVFAAFSGAWVQMRILRRRDRRRFEEVLSQIPWKCATAPLAGPPP